MPYDVAQLLTYSQGIVGDWLQKNPLANFLAPQVPVVTEKFFYKNYGVGNAFNNIDTRRSIGGSAARLSYTVTDASAVLEEDALETAIDDIERRQNPESESQLEMIKIRDLSLTIMNNDFRQLLTFIYANVSVTAGSGAWSTNTNDPVKEVDAQIQAIADATGLVPNRIYFDLTAWIKCRGNQTVMSRVGIPGVGRITSVQPEQFASMLSMPCDVRIGGGAKFTGSSTNNFLLFYGQDSPSQQDPSMCKTFTRNSDRFSNVLQYRAPSNRSDVYAIDWQQLRLITAPALVVRLAIT
jgi:hypothetical protein